jgi:hypothetical protein
MKSGFTRGGIALLTSLSLACGGRSCGTSSNAVTTSAGQTGSSPAELKQPAARPGSAAATAASLRTAQADLDAALRGTTRSLSADAIAARLQLAFDAVRRIDGVIPTDSFEPATVVQQNGRAPDALLAWVRSETRLVPYRGVLRGARGVLMDRVGNSLDRSLLLARLLELAGSDVRLAHITLGRSQAEAILKEIRETPSMPAPRTKDDGTSDIAESLIAEYAKRFQVSADSLRERLSSLRAAEKAMGDEAAKRAATQAVMLRTLADLTSVDGNGETPKMVEALTDHWWVQLKQDAGWTNLDPVGVVSASSPPSGVVGTMRADAVPAELRHRMRVQVLIECACGKTLIERPVLEHTIDLAEQAYTPIVLQQAPAAALSPDGIEPNEAGWRQLRDWVLQQGEWMPALSVGDRVITQSAFTLDGDVHPPGSKPEGGAPGGIVDAFGGGEEPPSGRMTAEIVQYEITSPGMAPRIARRMIADWLGSQARATSATPATDLHQNVFDLVHQVEILPLIAQPSSDFVAHLAATEFMNVSAIAQAAAMGRAPSFTATEPSRTLSFQLLELALARNSWNPDRSVTYLQETNVLTRHGGVQLSKGDPELWNAFDIVFNRIGVHPSVSAASAREIRSRQGALDTNAEVMLDARYGAVTNVSEQMALGSETGWRAQPTSSAETLRIQNEAGPADAGYWVIDRSDGSVLGHTSSGWGGVSGTPGDQGMTEFAIKHEKVIRAIGVIFKYMSYMACMAGLIRQMLTEGSSANVMYTMGRGAVKTLACSVAGYLGGLGIIQGGALGNLMSRTSDVFSLALTISSWIP